MSVVKVDPDRGWKIVDGKFCEEAKLPQEDPREITEDFLYFPKATSEITIETLKKYVDIVDITDAILNQKGAWSIVYYNKALGKVFIGRDVFGRQPLFINIESLHFGVRQRPKVPGTSADVEVPYGQVTVFDLMLTGGSPKMSTYHKEYPQELLAYIPYLSKELAQTRRNTSLLRVSRSTGGQVTDDIAEEFFKKVRDATEELLKNNTDSHLAICFSGGVESEFMAHVVHAAAPVTKQIDLIFVTLAENNLGIKSNSDREQAQLSFEALRTKYGTRNFRLILVDVIKQEQDLIKGDDPTALSGILWSSFRSMGSDADNKQSATSPASTCFYGSGTNALFAGHARHRNRFLETRNAAKVAELCEADVRTLGVKLRKNVRVADHLNKTVLYPFLEDDVVAWLNALPIDSKCDLSSDPGIGHKKLLRRAVELRVLADDPQNSVPQADAPQEDA